MNILQSTWAFKLKHFPDGLINMLKAWFCAGEDQQIESINFFETFAPVVQWTTICFLPILEVLLGLKSKERDITASLLDANFEGRGNLFVEKP